jgi:hypothetical protein
MARKKEQAKIAPHLIQDGRFHRCSVCKMPFLTESDRSLPEGFANHVKGLHQLNQTPEEMKWAAELLTAQTQGNQGPSYLGTNIYQRAGHQSSFDRSD